MKKEFLKASLLSIFSLMFLNLCYAQEYKKYTGKFYKNSTVMCYCNSQGLLEFIQNDGTPYTLTLCFDKEPGSFYEIFNGETITVEGYIERKVCNNGTSYPVLYVKKSEMQIQQRQELIPEFIKKQPTGSYTASSQSKQANTTNVSTSTTSKENKTIKYTGKFYKNKENTVMCYCNSQGLLTYNKADGTPYTLTLCFDNEPGSFYEIFNGETITVEGNLVSKVCNNGKTYSVLYVTRSEMQMQQRQELIPEFIKKQPTGSY